MPTTIRSTAIGALASGTEAEEPTTAVGVFIDLTQAEQAIEELRDCGFASDRIGFVAADPTSVQPPVEAGTQAGKDAAIGASVGGVLGTALGLAVAAVAFPVGGPAIVGGLLGGAITGGVSGGILGALMGLNIPEEEARHCEEQFHSGRCLVTVQAGERYADAIAIMRRVAERPERHHNRNRADPPSDAGDGYGSVMVPLP
jgi:hypothetical protein